MCLFIYKRLYTIVYAYVVGSSLCIVKRGFSLFLDVPISSLLILCQLVYTLNALKVHWLVRLVDVGRSSVYVAVAGPESNGKGGGAQGSG